MISRRGIRPWAFSSVRKNRTAARRFRRDCTRMSRSSPSSSTARHRYCWRPWIVTNTSSRCQCSAPGFLDSGLKVITSTLPRQPVEIALHLGWTPRVVLRQHPLLVVRSLKLEQGEAEFLDRFEAPHPQEILLSRPDETLRDPITFGLSHEARGTLNPEERDLLLEIVSQVVRAVVVAQTSPSATPSPRGPKRSRTPWRIGSRASNRVPRVAAWRPMHSVVQ